MNLESAPSHAPRFADPESQAERASEQLRFRAELASVARGGLDAACESILKPSLGAAWDSLQAASPRPASQLAAEALVAGGRGAATEGHPFLALAA